MLFNFIFAGIAVVSANEVFCMKKEEFITNYSDRLSPPYERVFKSEPLYKGHFGRVYGCTMEGVSSVAKLLNIKTESHYLTFKNEKKMAQLLSNTKGVVVPYACVLKEKNEVTFFMLQKGPSLSVLREEFQKLHFSRKLLLFIRIGDIMVNVRNESIIHNDLKPGNIVAADRHFSDVFVIDFGGACLHGEMCHGGTRAFSAPEKLNNRYALPGEYSGDVWSYLVTVISLYSGARGGQILDIFKNNLQCWERMTVECYDILIKAFQRSLKGAPAWFISIILSALRYTPEKRPHIADVVKKLRSQGQ